MLAHAGSSCWLKACLRFPAQIGGNRKAFGHGPFSWRKGQDLPGAARTSGTAPVRSSLLAEIYAALGALPLSRGARVEIGSQGINEQVFGASEVIRCNSSLEE